jgi:putative FmdB family regulatory protein
MPLYEFVCYACGAHNEQVRRVSERDHPCACPRCGDPMIRTRIHPVSLPPSSAPSALEATEAALFSPAERAAAARDGRRLLTGPADIARYERDHGLSRIDPGSAQAATARADAVDQARDDAALRRQEGTDAVADRIVRDEVQALTGWDNAHYSRWKDAQDAAHHAVESGAVPGPADSGA